MFTNNRWARNINIHLAIYYIIVPYVLLFEKHAGAQTCHKREYGILHKRNQQGHGLIDLSTKQQTYCAKRAVHRKKERNINNLTATRHDRNHNNTARFNDAACASWHDDAVT